MLKSFFNFRCYPIIIYYFEVLLRLFLLGCLVLFLSNSLSLILSFSLIRRLSLILSLSFAAPLFSGIALPILDILYRYPRQSAHCNLVRIFSMWSERM